MLSIDGKAYGTTNLSVSGSMIEGYKGSLAAGSLFSVYGIGQSAKNLSKVDIRARVNRADPKTKQLELTFMELDTGAYDILQNAMAKQSK